MWGLNPSRFRVRGQETSKGDRNIRERWGKRKDERRWCGDDGEREAVHEAVETKARRGKVRAVRSEPKSREFWTQRKCKRYTVSNHSISILAILARLWSPSLPHSSPPKAAC